jgi:hypothetical protein
LSMYAINSKANNWWEDVNVIIWGASARLTGEDAQVQSEMKEMIQQGVSVEACRDCADNFGVTEKLEKLGINVRYMGLPLTEYIKQDQKLICI